MKVGDLCNRTAITASASAQVSGAARLMYEKRVGAVVATTGRADRPIAVGILTDRDIVCAQLDRTADLSQLRLGDIMTPDPLVLNEDTSTEEAIRCLRHRHVRRAPVISSGGELVGVISFDDLLAHVSGNLRALAHLAEVLRGRQAPPHEPRERWCPLRA